MAKSYQIIDDTVYSVNNDGSITKHITIMEDGSLINRNGKKLSIESRPHLGYWVFIVALSVAALSFAIMYIAMKGKFNSAEDTIEGLNYDIEKLKEDVKSQERYREAVEDDLQTLKRRVGNTMPLIVGDIKIANVYYEGEIETDYGKTIYSHNTMYLKPKIDYYGISSGAVTLYVKLITPYGYVSQGSSSPQGYSYSQECYIYSGDNNSFTLQGWGNKTKGHWERGTYRIEIWYKGTCLKSKIFTIY